MRVYAEAMDPTMCGWSDDALARWVGSTDSSIGTLDEVHDDGMVWLIDMAEGFGGPTAVCEVTE